MPRDYAKRAPNRSRNKKNDPRVPAWVWLFTGVVLGAFIMFLIHLSKNTSTHTTLATSKSDQKASSESVQTVEPKSDTQTQSPRFTFYEMLKNSEVKTPANKPSKQSQIAQDKTEFILQVASFKSESDAQQVRAELILLNLEASVEQAVVRNGETWHRVLVGPFTDRSRMSKARSTLISNQFEALVLKKAQ